jgi:3-dehydroquinate synthase
VTSERGREPRVTVRADGGRADYPVVLAGGALEWLGELARERLPGVRRWAVISDTTVAPLYAPAARASLEGAGLASSVHTFPAGEKNKTRKSWSILTDELVEQGLGRDGGVVALGGGVVGDLAGFVAATFMRGVPVVQVPTSVVAMVDSAVGGKTGVDTGAGKNLVGSFHPPALVLVDPTTLRTLPPAQRAQGWAEAVKHGAILDEPYLRDLERDVEGLLGADAAVAGAAVARSIELKAGVVGLDEREADVREVLNFGHTLGHALEAESGYELSHGSAVSIGMVLEARLGESVGVTARGSVERLAAVLSRLGLPTTPPDGLDAARVEACTHRDKKVRGGHPRFVLLERIGSVAQEGGWAREVSSEAVLSVLAG